MDLHGRTALVTGANRGLGAAITAELIARGATVWAAARHPEEVTTDGAHPIHLDLTDRDSISDAAARLDSLDLLVNNAGILSGVSLLHGARPDIVRELDTNFFGTLDVTRAMAPLLIASGGGSVLNVLSVLSWISLPGTGAYCASKAAEWSMTNALRQEFAPHGIAVTALHVGYMDTEMVGGRSGPKLDPADVARAAVDAIEHGDAELVLDDWSHDVQHALSEGLTALYPAGRALQP